MTTDDKLERIAAKCRELLAKYKDTCHVEMPTAEAGWRATIAAIEFIQRTEMHGCSLACEILAAWEGLV